MGNKGQKGKKGCWYKEECMSKGKKGKIWCEKALIHRKNVPRPKLLKEKKV